MEVLSFFSSALYILIQFAIYFPSGYLLLNKGLRPIPFVISLPIFVSLGLVLNSIILSLVGLAYIGNGTLIILTIIFYGILTYKLVSKSSATRQELHNPKRIMIQTLTSIKSHLVKSVKNISQVVSILLFVLTISHFSLVAGYLEWPPGVDAINLGFLTSILVNNQKLETNLSPSAPSQPWFEPIGVPVMASSLTFLFDIFPGEALLLFATAVASLTIMSIYSLVFVMTYSTAFSSLALFSGFYIYPATSDIRFLEKWLIGFYYNTPYPTLFGYLTLLTFMVCWIAITHNNQHGERFKCSRLSKIFSFVGIIIAYTPFVILPGIYIIVSYLEKKGMYLLKGGSAMHDAVLYTVQKALLQKKALILFGVLIFVLASIATGAWQDSGEEEGSFNTLFERIQANAYFYSGIVLNPNFFANYTGLWTLAAYAITTLSFIRKRRVNLSIFYLLISTIIIVSSLGGDIINNFLWFFFPGRLFAFLTILNWIVISIFLNDLVRSAFLRKEGNRSKKIDNGMGLSDSSMNICSQLFLSSVRTAIVLALSFVFFLPSLISNLSLEQAEHWNWIFGRESFVNDYSLFAWISRNVNASDLIMIDSTYASRSLDSFSLMNITASPFPNSSEEVERDKNNAIAWNRPTLLRSFIDRYDVKYILLDSEPYHRIAPEVAGDDEYTQRVYDLNQYKEIFDHMPFLKVVKKFGDSTLYKVSTVGRQ